jgi:DNA polymerase
VARKLALLIRPTFVPRNDTYTFVVSDFSQVEARILPWLAGDDSSGALARLQIFRDIDANPALPDLYVRTASEMSTVDIAAVTKAMRQRGKVAELALGFGGGVGALAAMAANYGMYLDEAEARETVYRWRDANQWCVRFWGKHNDEASYGLWGAANRALMRPGVVQRTGRIAFVYVPKNAGTLYCALPSGRYLAYRGIRYEQVAETDDDGVIVGYSLKLRFWKGIARSTIWHGTLTENCVQAVAADLLRGTLVRLEHMGLHTRLHSHDEVLLEVPVEHANNVVHELRLIMRKGFSWSEGLPLMSEEEILPYYSKWEAPKQIAQAAE